MIELFSKTLQGPKCTSVYPILAQCSISIPPENVRKTGFLTFSGGTEMEH